MGALYSIIETGVFLDSRAQSRTFSGCFPGLYAPVAGGLPFCLNDENWPPPSEGNPERKLSILTSALGCPGGRELKGERSLS